MGADGEEVNVVSVRFLYETGDPSAPRRRISLVRPAARLQLPEEGGGSGEVTVASGARQCTASIPWPAAGSTASAAGGPLQPRHGECECFTGYASGNGLNENARGTRGDWWASSATAFCCVILWPKRPTKWPKRNAAKAAKAASSARHGEKEPIALRRTGRSPSE